MLWERIIPSTLTSLAQRWQSKHHGPAETPRQRKARSTQGELWWIILYFTVYPALFMIICGPFWPAPSSWTFGWNALAEIRGRRKLREALSSLLFPAFSLRGCESCGLFLSLSKFLSSRQICVSTASSESHSLSRLMRNSSSYWLAVTIPCWFVCLLVCCFSSVHPCK